MDVWIYGSPALRQNLQGRIAVVYEDGRQFVAEIGTSTNNEAEYLALIEALKSCNEGDIINTDSELLVGHLNKNWKVKAEILKALYKNAKALFDKKKMQAGFCSQNQ